MININYQKRKNTELFKSLENPETLFLTETQNYIPIYTKFFSLNESNYNNINLNNKWYISSINEQIEDNTNLYNCRIKNMNNNKIVCAPSIWFGPAKKNLDLKHLHPPEWIKINV